MIIKRVIFSFFNISIFIYSKYLHIFCCRQTVTWSNLCLRLQSQNRRTRARRYGVYTDGLSFVKRRKPWLTPKLLYWTFLTTIILIYVYGSSILYCNAICALAQLTRNACVRICVRLHTHEITTLKIFVVVYLLLLLLSKFAYLVNKYDQLTRTDQSNKVTIYDMIRRCCLDRS